MKVEKGVEQLLFTTLRIEMPGSVGTGFIVGHEWRDKKSAENAEGYFLITNKHVIKNTNSGQFKFTNRSDDGRNPHLGNFTCITVEKKEWGWWTGHPSDDIDIAAFPLNPALNRLPNKFSTVFSRSISTDMFPEQDILEEIGAVEDIIFVGYPNDIYDTKNNLPIVRKGITATHPHIDYEGRPVFLIDASVFPGSSGSPVFIYNAGPWTTKEGIVVGDYRVIFLGVLASVLCQEVDGSLYFKEIPTNIEPVVRTRESLDLGVVYKARTVLETIEYLLRKFGELLPDDA